MSAVSDDSLMDSGEGQSCRYKAPTTEVSCGDSLSGVLGDLLVGGCLTDLERNK